MKRFLNLLACVALTWGCSVKTTPNAALQAPPSPPAVKAPIATGKLTVSFRWPNRPLYKTSVIPLSTDRATLEVSHGENVLIPEEEFERTDSAISTKSVEVQALNGLTVLVRAYRGNAKIAEGSAVVNVLPSKNSNAGIHLGSLYIPTITSLQNNYGAAGEQITINGSNFGTGSVGVEVLFNGTKSPSVSRISNSQLTVTVPNGVTSGNVVIKADGVESLSNAVFWVPGTLSVSTTKESWDTNPPGLFCVMYGATKSINPTVSWVGDVSPYGAPPSCTWESSNALSGTLNSEGVFTASRNNQLTLIKARYGSVESTALNLLPVGFDSITLDRTELTLNALPGIGLPDPGFITSTTLVANLQKTAPFSNGIQWTSSAPGIATVSQAGYVSTVPNGPEGTAIITATSLDDPSVYATASVTVTIEGNLALEVL